MKKFTLLFLCSIISISAFSQLNCALESTTTYGSLRLNDIWGYEAGGSEYALVGTRTGVNILDISNPAAPVDCGTATGPTSVWRDIKTWGNYAYITNETGGGLLVIDLSNLPTPITTSDYFYWEPNIPDLGGLLTDCHNIYIDENGYGYLAGCNRNNGGPIYIDLFSDPLMDGSPVYVDKGANIYAHDIYTEGNIMYTSEIYEGEFAIYDVSNKSATLEIGRQATPYAFTHNAWPDGGSTLYTTDELSNASVAAYDVSTPGSITLLDEFRPLETVGMGETPHNVHVINDYLVISYYSLGVIIVDASDPTNLIEVGNYDTCTGSCSGAWGAFPFFTSGTIIASDMVEGCFVLTPTYVRAARIEGKVTDATTGSNINNAKVEINVTQANATNTDFQGNYKTGIASAGTFNVTVTAPGYNTQVISNVFTNGTTNTLDVQMVSSGLAIDLLDFEVSPNEEGGIDLNWAAQTDDPAITFEIERSLNGFEYEKIGEVADDQPSLVAKTYHFTDQGAPYGKLYYRLKMIDPAGEENLSPVRNLHHLSTNEELIKVYPNPINSGGRLTFEVQKLNAKQLRLEVFNGTGTLMDQVIYHPENQQGFYATDNLPRGIYFLKFMDHNGRLIHLERLSISK